MDPVLEDAEVLGVWVVCAVLEVLEDAGVLPDRTAALERISTEDSGDVAQKSPPSIHDMQKEDNLGNKNKKSGIKARWYFYFCIIRMPSKIMTVRSFTVVMPLMNGLEFLSKAGGGLILSSGMSAMSSTLSTTSPTLSAPNSQMMMQVCRSYCTCSILNRFLKQIIGRILPLMFITPNT